MTNKFLSRMRVWCAFAMIGLLSQTALADTVFTGVEGGTFTETTITSNASVTSGGINNNFSVGGEGNAAPISFSTGFGGMGEAGVGGFLAPVLRAKSTGFSDEGVYTNVGMMATYQYNGTSSATVTYNWALDAVLTETDPDNAAFLRYRAGLVTGADFYDIRYNNFFESSATVEDSINFTQNFAGTIDASGSLSFTADPGEVFYLSTLLAPYAGRDGAIADAFSTATGSFSVTGGGSIVSLSAIPEPAAGSIVGLIGLAGLAMRRRKS